MKGNVEAARRFLHLAMVREGLEVPELIRLLAKEDWVRADALVRVAVIQELLDRRLGMSPCAGGRMGTH